MLCTIFGLLPAAVPIWAGATPGGTPLYPLLPHAVFARHRRGHTDEHGSPPAPPPPGAPAPSDPARSAPPGGGRQKRVHRFSIRRAPTPLTPLCPFLGPLPLALTLGAG